MTRLVAYLRPLADGPDVDEQLRAVGAWARRQRHSIAHVAIDASNSDGLASRTSLADTFAKLRRDDIGGIAVCDLRVLDEDLLVQELLIAEIRRTGGTIRTVRAADRASLARYPADPTRQAIRQVIDALADHEPALRSLREAATRQVSTGGSPPFGYQIDGGRLVSDPQEQRVVARMSQLAGEGLSLRQIARVLGHEGHRPKRGAAWSPETVRRILARQPGPPPVPNTDAE